MLLALGPSLGMLLNVLFYAAAHAAGCGARPMARASASEPRAPPRQAGGLAGMLATARDIAGNRIVVSMTLVAGASSFLSRQRLSGADAANSPPTSATATPDFYYSMLLAANALGRAGRGHPARKLAAAAGAARRLAFVLVMLWCFCIARLCGFDGLPAFAGAAVRGRLPQPRVRLHVADAGAAACAASTSAAACSASTTRAPTACGPFPASLSGWAAAWSACTGRWRSARPRCSRSRSACSPSICGREAPQPAE